MADTAISIHALSKRYGRSKNYALKELSLHVNAGEIYGFLGPNGAGKSTTIRTLLNFIQPSAGSALIAGLDIVRDSVEIKSKIGYLASDMALYPKLTGNQFLAYMCELQGLTDRSYQHELVRRLKADGKKKLGDLSRGNRQKFAIVQAFMHKPDVLILDEPSSGLDPLMQETFYELLGEAKSRGASIFMSSHILSEVQKVCDRVGIIRDGRLIDERNIAEMTQEAAHTFAITFKQKPPLAELKKLTGVRIITHTEHQVTLQLHGSLPPFLATIAKHDVTQLEARQLDLEELFMHYYSGQEQH